MKTETSRKQSSQTVSRRNMLIGGAAVSSFMLMPRYVLGGNEHTAPSDKLNVAIIGTGGRGTQNMRELIGHKDVHVMAVCDVNEFAEYSRFYYGGVAGRRPAKEICDDRYAADEATKDYPKCLEYIDFREMLDKEKSIDAVVVATPDHNHAINCIEAIKRGKHVYCEKPLARTVYECRKITEAAREMKVATQLGNQGHSGEGIRNTVEWIKDGAIGDVTEVISWHNGGTHVGIKHERSSEMPVPDGLNWDLWLGPAEKRPYSIDYAPYTWRGWWDFGTGAAGDFFCHNADPAFWALDFCHPISVEATQYGSTKETCSQAAVVYYNFPARGKLPPIRMTWYAGLMPPKPNELGPNEKLVGGGNGIMFVGTKGKITCPGWAGDPIILPHELDKEYKRPEKTLKRSNGHHRDWIDACKGGEPASSNFEYSGFLTEMAMLGNAAIRVNDILYWDGENMKATNTNKAESFIKPEYHNGWTI